MVTLSYELAIQLFLFVGGITGFYLTLKSEISLLKRDITSLKAQLDNAGKNSTDATLRLERSLDKMESEMNSIKLRQVEQLAMLTKIVTQFEENIRKSS